jgi:hypothetical protein
MGSQTSVSVPPIQTRKKNPEIPSCNFPLNWNEIPFFQFLLSRLYSTSKDIPKAFTTLSSKKVVLRRGPMLLHLLLFVPVPGSSFPTSWLRAGDDDYPAAPYLSFVASTTAILKGIPIHSVTKLIHNVPF